MSLRVEMLSIATAPRFHSDASSSATRYCTCPAFAHQNIATDRNCISLAPLESNQARLLATARNAQGSLGMVYTIMMQIPCAIVLRFVCTACAKQHVYTLVVKSKAARATASHCSVAAQLCACDASASGATVSR